MPAAAWERHAAGQGAAGPICDWARHSSSAPTTWAPGEHWLLIRRSRKDKTDCAYYVVFAPKSRRAWLIRSGRRPALDHRGVFPIRQGRGRPRPLRGVQLAWLNRHVTLAMQLALAYLAALRPRLAQSINGKQNKRSPANASPAPRRSLSVQEIRSLIVRFQLPSALPRSRLYPWSPWRGGPPGHRSSLPLPKGKLLQIPKK